MKNALLSFFMVIAIAISAQQIPDGTYTDCNNQTMSIHATLASGKVLIIALKGLDCSICKSHAADYQNFISTNQSTITGWGAMIYLYNTSATATCADMNAWKNSYGWTNIFQFADANLDFLTGGTPRYIVIDPSDSTIAYSGPNLNTAKQTALGLVAVVGLEELNINNVKLYQNGSTIHIDGIPNGRHYQASLIDVVGNELANWENDAQNNVRLNVPLNIQSGVHIIRIQVDGDVIARRIHWLAD